MVTTKAYDHIIDFIISGMPLEQIVSFRPPIESMRRVEYLIFKEKEEQLTKEEKSELEQYLFLEHIMRLAKARARKELQQ